MARYMTVRDLKFVSPGVYRDDISGYDAYQRDAELLAGTLVAGGRDTMKKTTGRYCAISRQGARANTSP